MALFSAKKKTVKAKKSKEVTAVKIVAPQPQKNLSSIILRPRITEKATMSSEKSVYVFEINPNSGKKDVILAILDLYKVTPRKVRITKNPAKAVFIRGKSGTKSGIKKAYVYLKDGDKIEII